MTKMTIKSDKHEPESAQLLAIYTASWTYNISYVTVKMLLWIVLIIQCSFLVPCIVLSYKGEITYSVIQQFYF